MLSELDVTNFTAFENAKFKFSSGLNVIVGANGAGKSHILKLAYSVAKTSFNQNDPHKQSKAVWQKSIADDLNKIFRPESLGRLARRQQGASKVLVGVKFEKLKDANFSFSFSTKSSTDVQLINDIPSKFASVKPIFIPTKELLSLFPGLRALYNSRELSIDETYPDLCEKLEHPLLRGPRLEAIKNIVEPLEEMVGGEVKNEHGKFYLYQKEGGRLEIDLVAEGLRKLATLSFLLKNGSLTETSALFWDEPEANLNPLLIRKLAKMLVLLSANKFQIIIATHSLFLLKELHILSKESKVNKVRYFGLSANGTSATEVSQAEDLETLPEIASLDAELEQTDRFAEVINQEDND
jgi:predicted ATPase